MEPSDQKIAVLTDQYGKPTDFPAAYELILFAKDMTWHKEQVLTVSSMEMNSIAKIRSEAQNLIRQIAPCTIIAARDISGIPYAVFDLAKFRIFTILDINDEVLDGILADIAESEERVKESVRHQTTPTETDLAGYYYMDLVTLQTENPDISSKMALADFLKKTPFMELTLRCGHVPPWIEKTGAFTIHTQQTGSEITARIKKKLCRE